MSENNGYKAAEFRGMMIQKMDYVIEKIDSMDKKYGEANLRLHKRIDRHNQYHEENEHKWGFWTFLKKKPLFAIMLGLIIAGSLISAGINIDTILKIIKVIK